MNTTRRSTLAALAAVPAVLVGARPAEATKPLPNPWDRLSRRLDTIRGRLSLHRRGEAPEVAELRRAVVRLTEVVQDLVDLENPRP